MTVSGFTEYFLKSLIANFSDRVVPLSAFSLNTFEDGAIPGDIVQVAYSDTTDSAYTFSHDTGFNTTGSTVTNKNITLGSPTVKQWTINDQEFKRLSNASLERQMGAAGLHGQKVAASLAASVLTTVFTHVTSSTYPVCSIGASSLNTQANFALLQKQCDILKWPDQRAIIASPTLYATIASNSNLVAYAYGSPELVKSGRLPQYMGYDLYMANNVPAQSDSMLGFAANPDGVLVALAPFVPQDGNTYNVVQTITDEKTGIALTYREWYQPDYGRMQRVVSAIAGVATGNVSGSLVIRTTP